MPAAPAGANREQQHKLNCEDITMKKMNKMIAASLAAVMGLSLAACGSSASSSAAASSEAASGAAEAKTYRVAIVQQLDHASLNEIRKAAETELDAKAAELGVTIEYTEFNGQNDATTLNQIGSQVVSDGYDAVMPIATLAAQCM